MTLFDNNKDLLSVHTAVIGMLIKNKIYNKNSRCKVASERQTKQNFIFYAPQARGAFCLLFCPREK